MPYFFQHLLSFIAGGALLVILDRVMQPAPVAALPAFVLGAAAYYFSRPARVAANVSVAVAIGAMAGMFIHRQWHITGQSPPPTEGLLNHLAHEGLVGLVAGLACVGVAALVERAFQRRAG